MGLFNKTENYDKPPKEIEREEIGIRVNNPYAEDYFNVYVYDKDFVLNGITKLCNDELNIFIFADVENDTIVFTKKYIKNSIITIEN